MIAPTRPRRPPGRAGFALILAVAGMLVAGPLSGGIARADGLPDSLLEAAIDDLVERQGLDAVDVELARAVPVLWPDRCLGAPAPGEACFPAVTRGFVFWLAAGDDAYRYHADGGTAARFVEGSLPARDVARAALPADAQELNPLVPGAAGLGAVDLADALDRYGLRVELTRGTGVHILTPVMRSVLLADAATVEVFEVADRMGRDFTSMTVRAGGGDPPRNALFWSTEQMLVILLDAERHPRVATVLEALLGPPDRDTRQSPSMHDSTGADAGAVSPPVPRPAATGTGAMSAPVARDATSFRSALAAVLGMIVAAGFVVAVRRAERP